MPSPNISLFTRTNSFGEEKERIFPEFYTESVQDDLASSRMGHPVYREEERVRLHIPANPWTSPVEIVREEHRQRWPNEYASFKKGLEMAHDGTPIEQWPILNKSMVKWLKHHDIHTVEQCAAIADNAIQNLGMGARALRQKAQAFLSDAERMSMVESL